MARLKTGVLISGRGSNLQALIEACQADDHRARIVAVISDRDGIRALERAQSAQIPTYIVDRDKKVQCAFGSETRMAAHAESACEYVNERGR